MAEAAAFLEKAAICAVLAPAGPQRQRVMGTLLRVPRVARASAEPIMFGLTVKP